MAAFGIKIGDTFLDLYVGTALSFELNNSAYLGDDIDVVQNSFMFKVKVPISNRNKSLLNYPDRADNASKFIAKVACGIYCEGSELYRGTLDVKSGTPVEAEVYVLVNTISVLRDTQMNELKMGSVSYPTDLFTHALATCLNPEKYNYIFHPVANIGFWNVVNNDFDNRAIVQNNYETSKEGSKTISAALRDRCNFTPFLKLDFVLRSIFNDVGFTFINNFQTDDELKLITLFNNVSLINYFDETTSINYSHPTNIVFANFLSQTKVSDFLKRLARLFNLSFETNYFDKTVTLVRNSDILNAQSTDDWTNLVISEPYITEDINFPKKIGSAIASDSVIPIKILDTSSRLISRNDDTGFTFYNIEDRRIVNVRFTEEFHDSGISFSETSDFESAITALPTCTTLTQTMPIVKQKGVSVATLPVDNAFDDHVMLYRGIVNSGSSNASGDDATYMYPAAITEDTTAYNKPVKRGWDTYTTPKGNPPHSPAVDINYTLNWRGEKGIYNRFHRGWYEMLMSKRDVKVLLNLSVKQIREFSFSDQKTIKNKSYIVKKLRVILTEQGVQPTEAQLICTI